MWFRLYISVGTSHLIEIRGDIGTDMHALLSIMKANIQPLD